MKYTDNNICKFVTNRSPGQLDVTNFVFEKRAAMAGRRQTRSTHVIHLAVTGTGRLVTDDTTALLAPGTLFVTFAGQEYTIESSDSLTYMYISFTGTRVDDLFTRIGIAPDFCVFPDYEGLVTFWQNAIGRASAKNLDLISESVLLYTFSQLAAFDDVSEKALINRMLHYIETEYTTHALSLTALSEYIGYNPKYISRCFREHVGMTFSDYVKNIRIRHAVFLIEQGVRVVKNVALLSGFSDPLYFSGCFRKIVGMSPTEYIAKQTTDAEPVPEQISPEPAGVNSPEYCNNRK